MSKLLPPGAPSSRPPLPIAVHRGYPDRDYIGYGARPPAFHWPNGARVALSIVVNYEEGTERTFVGDGRNEALGELARPVDGKRRDVGLESVFEYGSRAGVYRLLRLFDRYGVKTTFFAAAEALALNPEVSTWLAESGHEPCAHGLRWREEWDTARDDERKRIHEAVDLIRQACGERPVGWMSRWMPSENTRELLVEEGGFLYDSDAYNDDLPYYVWSADKPFLILPYTQLYNDAKYFMGGLSSPFDFLDYCRRALDFQLREGDTHPTMLSIGIHGRWTGHAGRAAALEEFLEHALSVEGVWIARRRDIAEWWLANFPPDVAAQGSVIADGAAPASTLT